MADEKKEGKRPSKEQVEKDINTLKVEVYDLMEYGGKLQAEQQVVNQKVTALTQEIEKLKASLSE